MPETKSIVPLWERPALRETAGQTLRPGGLALTERGLTLAAIPENGKILDVGCGLGATVKHLINVHNFKACGIDSSHRQLEKADSKLPLKQAEAHKIPYENGSFDGLFCECVLSLVQNLSQTVTEFARVLKPRGKLIISDLYQRNNCAPQSYVKDSCANKPLDLAELEMIMEKNGLRILSLEDHSKLLVELAAKLIFTGEIEYKPEKGCCSKPGYMLLIATSCT